jgi:Tol biopolymer transport system component
MNNRMLFSPTFMFLGLITTACTPSRPPDRIAFVSERDGNYESYVMNADGGGSTNLTNDPAYDSSPIWSPR